MIRALADISLPRALREPVFGPIAERIGMNLGEAELSLSDYDSFGELFVRRLRDGQRPIDATDGALVSPVDGCVSICGIADGDSLVQAKGIDYSLAELVDDAALAERLQGGAYTTIYLRPKDYHRIHTPVSGRIVSSRRVGAELFPVQPSVVRNLRGLFARNERVVIEIESDEVGVMALIAVGATAVGCITTVFGAPDGYRRYDPPIEIEKGDEVAAFNLGSTVILLCERGRAAFDVTPLQEVRVGQVIGSAEPAMARRRAGGGE
ncbi:MAG: phosphatidylserine decarboxylase [Myxococcales bacterium]|nr:phosphatidylserine decarboxylase [Myxococcales bacterium]